MNRLLYVLALASLARPGRSSSATNKLSLASWGSFDYRGHKVGLRFLTRLLHLSKPMTDITNLEGPGTYAFGYEIEDPVTGNVQFRQEERHLNGTVTGSYGYVDADGVPRVTNYVSDLDGYRIVPGMPATSANTGERAPHDPFNDNHAFPSAPFDRLKTDRIYNSPPLIYELAASAPFPNHDPNYLVPIPFLNKRK